MVPFARRFRLPQFSSPRDESRVLPHNSSKINGDKNLFGNAQVNHSAPSNGNTTIAYPSITIGSGNYQNEGNDAISCRPSIQAKVATTENGKRPKTTAYSKDASGTSQVDTMGMAAASRTPNVEMMDVEMRDDVSSTLERQRLSQPNNLLANPWPTPSTSNLLGGANPNQSQPSSSTLFPSLSNPQTGFGNTLFPGTNQLQPPQTSTAQFGTFGTSQSQQQRTGTSLFPALGTNPVQQTAGSTNLLTGANQTQQQQQQQQQQGGGLLGGFGSAQSVQPPQQPGTEAPFGASILINNPAPQQVQTPNGPQLQPSAKTPNGAYFDNLLERGKKRNDLDGFNRFGELPSLQLGLGDIASRVRHLGSGGRSGKPEGGDDSRAQYLLAASGIPRGTTLRDLNSLGVPTVSATPPAPSDRNDTDIATYVANLQARDATAIVNNALEQSKRAFDRFVEDNVQINWDLQRARIYEHFGLTKPVETSDAGVDGGRGSFGRSSRTGREKQSSQASFAKQSFGAPALSKSVLGSSRGRGKPQVNMFADVAETTGSNGVYATHDPYLRTKQENYAEKVKELNSARLQEVVYPVIEQFARVEIESGVDTQKHLVDSYRALKEITREKGDAYRPSEPGAIKERQYVEDYLDPHARSGRSVAMRKQIIEGSRRFLEDSFFQQLEDVIAKNPREANTGGIPSKINKVRAYVRLKATRKDLGTDILRLQMLGDDYCWVLVFYLLRCGLLKEAAQYVAENERAFKSMDRHFVQYIASYVGSEERRLPRDLQARINSEYLQRGAAAPPERTDVYRGACLKIIGRCELNRTNFEGINNNMEDWIWLLMIFARETNRVEEVAGETFGLDEVRDIVEEIGQRHFSRGGDFTSSYATFFLLQILGGKFEKAISWLYPHNYVAAVHFAIALDFYGLLRVSDFAVSELNLLTHTTTDLPQINFSRLLGYYTQDFRTARPEAAADYLILICLNADLPGQAGQSQASVCQEALKELVLETREFALLLGDIRADGKRVKGAIEQRLKLIKSDNQEDFLHNLTIQAAMVADDSGRITDAVLLYHLAESYDKVITIINRALSDALCVDLGEEPLRLQPLKPGSQTQQDQPNPQQQQTQPPSPQPTTLSLTSVDDPALLAQNMISLYNAHAPYFSAIRPSAREACGALLRMSHARHLTLSSRHADALDAIDSLNILPLRAQGDMSAIRAAAQTLNALDPVVARCVGHLLLWTVRCCEGQRDALRRSAFVTGAGDEVVRGLGRSVRDLMVFAGLVRYKLPAGVFEALAVAGQGF